MLQIAPLLPKPLIRLEMVAHKQTHLSVISSTTMRHVTILSISKATLALAREEANHIILKTASHTIEASWHPEILAPRVFG